MNAPILSSLGGEPWNVPWWKPAAGEWKTLLYVVSIHVLALIGLVLFPWPGWRILLVWFAVTWLGGVGITICYHRSIAHKALKLHRVIRHLFIFFAMFGGSGAPASWTANHRQHHSRVETPEDISSPWIGGFWWAHLRWLWQGGEVPLSRWCPDLNEPEYRFWTRVQIVVMILSLFGGLPFGAAAFFWLGPIPLLLQLGGRGAKTARTRRRTSSGSASCSSFRERDGTPIITPSRMRRSSAGARYRSTSAGI